MSRQRMQRWRVSPPKTISVKLFQKLVESLVSFMPGLSTIERLVETTVIANGQQNVVSGFDSWKAYQPFPLDKIEHIQFELTLKKSDHESCQLHVEFRQNHIFLSVSDIETGWRDAVFEEMERKLKSAGLFKGELGYKLTSTILRLQNIFIVTGTMLILFPEHKGLNLFNVGICFIATGVVPVVSDIFRIFFPQKPIQVLEEKIVLPNVNIEKSAAWVGLVSGVVTLAKELYFLVSSTGG
ncbi:hypothetical protein [Vibrio cholerae]|uniref:Uncharacterized protein n=1 Tax=Vibrio cholerae TaxID=666 RepID=A0A543XV02_VIBCL|nr:hypothetical protein [Vibrio cholerae]MBJ6954346.1 hypothetical protein [Vibrio cholerae]MCD6670810.1 hypothetical protein [Vibrio cholerae]TQO61188.1 hypothetical protein FLM08_16530 [Vibrio cholerae]TQP08487.1 hypothetical protein FLM02_18780 [Vibrio cholerae]